MFAKYLLLFLLREKVYVHSATNISGMSNKAIFKHHEDSYLCPPFSP